MLHLLHAQTVVSLTLYLILFSPYGNKVYSKYGANPLISLVQYISVNIVSRVYKACGLGGYGLPGWQDKSWYSPNMVIKTL